MNQINTTGHGQVPPKNSPDAPASIPLDEPVEM